MLRDKGIKAGLIRPITLWPFPYKVYEEAADKAKFFLDVEMSEGQMIEDVKLAVNCRIPVEHFGRLGGIVPDPDEIVEAMNKMIKK